MRAIAVQVGRQRTIRGLLASVGLAVLSALIATAPAVAAPVGTVTEFSNGIPLKADPRDTTAGPDGNVWFTEFAGGCRSCRA